MTVSLTKRRKVVPVLCLMAHLVARASLLMLCQKGVNQPSSSYGGEFVDRTQDDLNQWTYVEPRCCMRDRICKRSGCEEESMKRLVVLDGGQWSMVKNRSDAAYNADEESKRARARARERDG